MTGPVAVSGARPGHVLQVDIEAIHLHYDWGYNHVRPLSGALPDDFPDYRIMHIGLDRARNDWPPAMGARGPAARRSSA